MCRVKKKTPEQVEALPPKSPTTELSQRPSGGVIPVANATPGTIRSQSHKNSPTRKCQSAPNSVSRVTPVGTNRGSNVTPGAGSTSVSQANTPAGEQQKQEVIQVEPPKKMLARRKIDKVRDPRDPEYKTLEIGGSIWEAAELVKKSDLKKDDGKKTSGVQSRKSRKGV